VCDIIGRYVLLIGGSLNPYCSGKLNHFNHRFLPLFYAHENETAFFTKTGSGQTDGNLTYIWSGVISVGLTFSSGICSGHGAPAESFRPTWNTLRAKTQVERAAYSTSGRGRNLTQRPSVAGFV
jgi:hypothetical protein